MKHHCEYFPMTFGDYAHPAPDPVMCGEPADLKLRVTYFKDGGSIDHSDEVYSCLSCFGEALNCSGHDCIIDPTYDDLDDFDPTGHDPAYGPKYEILERLG